MLNSLHSGRDTRVHTKRDDDELLFADEMAEEASLRPDAVEAIEASEPWKILIVDDEQEVHEVTKLALDDIRFDGRGLDFLSAFSGAEACTLAAEHDDIALILLDVVMETEHAGLDVVRYVREQLGNRFTRIILRTGQPGQAPEKDVIVEYDINDYKAKTELTQQRMFTMVYTSLSSYRDLIALEANRDGLKAIVDASATMFDLHSSKHFMQRVLRQLSDLLYLGGDSRVASAFAAVLRDGELHVTAGHGRYAALSGRLWDAIPTLVTPAVRDRIVRAGHARQSIAGADHYVGYLDNGKRMDCVIYAEGEGPFTVPDWQLVELFCRNVTIARENIELKRESEETQREIVYLLGEAIEKRSNETGNHVRRVGEYCRLLGQLYGLHADETEILFMAAPLHDAGKIAIPDAILNKPGRHTAEEAKIMRTHAQHGADLLSGYERPVLQAAAIIAAQHHEKWDGTGYPKALRETEIHLYGRIAALADVFDALGSDRCYKRAWDLSNILDLMQAERGKHFDPYLVDLFLDNLDRFLDIRNRYSDRIET
ncbi:MAG: DUF3369 domain-containing protein [Proteobacteria bacterium]|nr:DUF3369 domain-containing protein [Pseudomonadota bacterium]